MGDMDINEEVFIAIPNHQDILDSNEASSSCRTMRRLCRLGGPGHCTVFRCSGCRERTHDLLKDMLKQLEKEAEEDEDIYDQFACCCDTNETW